MGKVGTCPPPTSIKKVGLWGFSRLLLPFLVFSLSPPHNLDHPVPPPPLATHVGLRLPADETTLAVVARPALSLKLLNQVQAVHPTRGVNGVAAAATRYEGLLLAHRVALVRAQAFHTDWQRSWTLKKNGKQSCHCLTVNLKHSGLEYRRNPTTPDFLPIWYSNGKSHDKLDHLNNRPKLIYFGLKCFNSNAIQKLGQSANRHLYHSNTGQVMYLTNVNICCLMVLLGSTIY